jgi:hypothetical protein
MLHAVWSFMAVTNEARCVAPPSPDAGAMVVVERNVKWRARNVLCTVLESCPAAE